jgi:hypothetical protein
MNALQIVQLRAPQWAIDPRVGDLIAYAREITSTDAFGMDSERAIALRVLHIFALEAQRAGNPGVGSSSGTGHAGQINSEKEGDLAKGFSTVADANKRYGNLSTTVYGQELIELIRGNVMGATTRRGNVSDVLAGSSFLYDPFA